MAIQLSIAVRDARLDVLESTISTSPKLRLYELNDSGSPPVDCAEDITGNATLLAEIDLPSNWMLDAATGSKSKTGTWQDLSADAAGNVDFFRIYESGGSTCHMQGIVTITGGGGDMTVDVVAVNIGNIITVTGFTLTDGNA